MAENRNVLSAAISCDFENGFHYFTAFGSTALRAPSSQFEGFNTTTYLANNPDIAVALGDQTFSSAQAKSLF